MLSPSCGNLPFYFKCVIEETGGKETIYNGSITPSLNFEVGQSSFYVHLEIYFIVEAFERDKGVTD